jgi:hypothetical protein
VREILLAIFVFVVYVNVRVGSFCYFTNRVENFESRFPTWTRCVLFWFLSFYNRTFYTKSGEKVYSQYLLRSIPTQHLIMLGYSARQHTAIERPWAKRPPMSTHCQRSEVGPAPLLLLRRLVRRFGGHC